MKVCLSLVVAGSDFAHMLYYPVRLLSACLEDLGHEVRVVCDGYEPGWTNVLIGGHHAGSSMVAQIVDSGPYVVLQSEILRDGQLWGRGTPDSFQRAYGHLLKHAKAVIEWVDERNAECYPHVPTVQLRPGYHEALRDIRRKREPDLDAVLLGGVTPYRAELLQRMRKDGLRVAAVTREHWPVRNDILARARCMIAPRYCAELDYWPGARVAYSLTNDIPVVVEDCQGWEWVEPKPICGAEVVLASLPDRADQQVVAHHRSKAIDRVAECLDGLACG